MTAALLSPSYKNGRLWDWPAALFLILGMFTAARRLMSTDWTENLGRIQVIVLFAILAGLALGASRFRLQTALLFSLGYGLFSLGWQLGQVMGDGIDWQERVASLTGRLFFALNQLFSGRSVTDPLLFLVMIMTLFWVLAFSAGFSLVRTGQPWQVVLPTGLGLLIIQSYDALVTVRVWYLAVYLLFGMLLVGRIYYIEKRVNWQRERTHMPLYIDVDLMRASGVIAALLLVFSFTAPVFGNSVASATAAWNDLTRPWQDFRSEFARAFTSLHSSVGVVSDFYGERLPLGRGTSLSDDVILTIETPRRRSSTIRFYWRARVYDVYDGYSWDVSFPAAQPFDAGETGLPLPYTNEARWQTEFDVTTKIALSMLYTASEPLSVSRPAEFRMTQEPVYGFADISSIRAEEPLLPGEIYTFKASVTAASIEELRAAGRDYPVWVSDRYLQVPPEVTTRTIELAHQIAGDLDNPYDIAEAVTQYLRENLTYTDVVPPLPQDQELVDWVLFDSGLAFCNYYATSEIMLLRILGIPARMAVGFAEGDRSLESEFIEQLSSDVEDPSLLAGEQLTTETYTVRQNDLHAWPEVYFPGIGWVEFEPTANQLPIARPLTNEFASETNAADLLTNQAEDELTANQEDSPANDEQQDENPAAEDPLVAIPWLARWLNTIIGVSVLLVAITGWQIARARGVAPAPVLLERGLKRLNLKVPVILYRWARNAALPPLERAYMEINHALKRLGEDTPVNATPAERAVALEAQLPMLAEPISTLRDEYHKSAYSPIEADLDQAREAARTIRSTSFVARIKRLFARVQAEDERDDLPTLYKKMQEKIK